MVLSDKEGQEMLKQRSSEPAHVLRPMAAVLALMLVATCSVLVDAGDAAANGVSSMTLTPNPTCMKLDYVHESQKYYLQVCVQATMEKSAYGLDVSYSGFVGFGGSQQYLTFTVKGKPVKYNIFWNNGSPAYSQFFPLNTGTYSGDASLCTYASFNCPLDAFVLRIGPAAVGMAVTPDTKGYWVVFSNGLVEPFGDAKFYGSMVGRGLNKPIIGMAATANGLGYWLLASDGGIFAFGDAKFLGSTGGMRLNKPIVGIASSTGGLGYWLVASDGGIFTFGDAKYHGSMGGTRLTKPIVGMAADLATGGYWLVASDGGVFSLDAKFYGSAGGLRLAAPIIGMAAARNGSGYRFVASDGGVFCFNQPSLFEGSLGGSDVTYPVVGMAPTSDAYGYWMVQNDSVVTAFGDAKIYS
jgi:hypothetical protein